LRIFLDECVDRRLARDLVGHDVKTAREMGWTSIVNGQLLMLAAEQFDIFLTVDRNLTFQQNLVAFSIAVVVLRAKTNRFADLRPLVSEVARSDRQRAARPGYIRRVAPVAGEVASTRNNSMDYASLRKHEQVTVLEAV